jgi:hypothetical protein
LAANIAMVPVATWQGALSWAKIIPRFPRTCGIRIGWMMSVWYLLVFRLPWKGMIGLRVHRYTSSHHYRATSELISMKYATVFRSPRPLSRPWNARANIYKWDLSSL